MTSEEGYLIQEYNSLRNHSNNSFISNPPWVIKDFKSLDFNEQENIIESLTRFHNRYKDCDLLKKLYQIRAANSIKTYFLNKDKDSLLSYTKKIESKFLFVNSFATNAIGFD